MRTFPADKMESPSLADVPRLAPLSRSGTDRPPLAFSSSSQPDMVRTTASAAMSATRTANASSASIPRYRNPALTSRLPPPKLPLFRSVVAHPPAPWATQQPESASNETLKKDVKGKGKGKADKVRERSLPDLGELGSGSAHWVRRDRA